MEGECKGKRPIRKQKINSMDDLWKYLCKQFPGHQLGLTPIPYYFERSNTPLAENFWDGVLLILEAEGRLDYEVGTELRKQFKERG